MLMEKNLQRLIGPVISKGSFKSKKNKKKNYAPSYLPGYGECENLCWFLHVAWTVSVSLAFVYNAADINKIATALLAKPSP